MDQNRTIFRRVNTDFPALTMFPFLPMFAEIFFVSEYAYQLRPDAPIRSGSVTLLPPPIASIAPTIKGIFILDWTAKVRRVYRLEPRNKLSSSLWLPVTQELFADE